MRSTANLVSIQDGSAKPVDPQEFALAQEAVLRCERLGVDWAAELRATGKVRWCTDEVLMACAAAELKGKHGKN